MGRERTQSTPTRRTGVEEALPPVGQGANSTSGRIQMLPRFAQRITDIRLMPAP
jgi:hypothetical protein